METKKKEKGEFSRKLGENNLKLQIGESECYGQAFDPNVRECKTCEVSYRCKFVCLGEKPPEPEDKIAKTVAKTVAKTKNAATTEKVEKKKKKTKIEPKDMPNFKSMSMAELELLAEERKAPDNWKKCVEERTKRMRLVMAIKLTY